MTLRDFIELLTDLAENEAGWDIEVVAHADDNEPYTPVVSIGTDRDGVRRLAVN